MQPLPVVTEALLSVAVDNAVVTATSKLISEDGRKN